MKQNTFVIPIIRPDFIEKCLHTLWENSQDFNVIVIDQTAGYEAEMKCEGLSHLWIRPYRNLGFSKAMNTGIRLSQTPYITLCNDDLEFIDPRWFQGIIDTFAMDKNIVAVNPSSPKEGGWGYGLTAENHADWIPPEEFIRDPSDAESVLPKMKDGSLFTLQKAHTKEGYDFLVNNHPRWKKGTVCDAIAMWCTVFSREGIEEIGMLDEQFYPGSGEDYDLNCRAYSCGWPERRDTCDPTFHRRMVGTTKSWVWHHWGRSKEISKNEVGSSLFASRDRWNDNGDLWEGGFDVWGHMDSKNGKVPLNRTRPVFIDEL